MKDVVGYAWNKDLKSVQNMTLEDLAKELPRLQELAKALWGEEEHTVDVNHVTRSEMPGYVDTTHPLHTSADIKMVQDADMRCFSCGKVLGGHHWIANGVCYRIGKLNIGWGYHLQQMVIAEDPIKYLGENIE